MIPVIALIGRPNVGKSTLFNRLTSTRQALVADFPGLTRDRQYGQATFKDIPFVVVDTGGMGIENVEIDELMVQQSQHALLEADKIFFVVDARAGLTPLDIDIANRVRKLNKSLYVVMNKADGLEVHGAASEFQSLGLGKVYPISATHGRGIQQLLEEALEPFETEHAVEQGSKESGVHIAFIGRPNVGKSTMINRLLGEERVLVYDLPGTTRDSIEIPFQHRDKHYVLIDTAGIRRRARVEDKIEKFSVIKTLQSIELAQVCLMLFDAKEGITDQDLNLLGLILEAGKALVIVVNKWDDLTEDQRLKIKSDLERRLNFVQFAKVRFVSALHGTGVGHLFEDIEQAYASAMQQFSTPNLTRLLEDIVRQHPPPLIQGRRIKLRYAHAGGHNPPVIVIHGNQLNKLPDSYTRYLKKAFMTHLKLVGTPLRLEYKSSVNPFKGKKNKLTPRQVQRRKRLIKHVKSKS